MAEETTRPPDEGLLTRLWGAWRQLFGFDLFISYRWSDGGAYAETLKTRLEDEGLTVFLDRHETPGGVRVRKDVRRSLLRSQAMVVVASPEAIENHDEITPEIDIFAGRHPRRPIFGIQFGNELSSLQPTHPWYPHFHKKGESDSLLWHTESSAREALATATVDARTIAYLLRSRTLLLRRRLASIIAATVTVAFVALAVTGTLSVVQRLEEGRRSLALARGFEAIDRSDESVLEALVVAADSLSIRDTFAGRRAAMSFWSQTPRITAANTLFLRYPEAVRARPDGGYDVIGSSGFTVRLEADLTTPYPALDFDPSSLTPGTSNHVSAADSDGRPEIVLGTRLGHVLEFNQDTGEMTCVLHRTGYEIGALSWIAGPDGVPSDWYVMGAYCETCERPIANRLIFHLATEDVHLELPLDHPEMVQHIERLPGRNCLVVAGKDWTDGPHSLSLVEPAVADGSVQLMSAPFVDEERFGLTGGQVSIELPVGDRPGRYLAVIDDSSHKDCGERFCTDLTLYQLDTRAEVARITRPGLRLVSFLPREAEEADSWLVVGDYDGGVWLHRAGDLAAGRHEGYRLWATGPSVDNRDELSWRNKDAVSFALRRPGNRVLLIGQDGGVFEVGLPNGEARFGRRLDDVSASDACPHFGPETIRRTTAGRRARLCRKVADTKAVPSAIIASSVQAWVFYPDRGVEVLDAKERTIGRGRSPETDIVAPFPISREDKDQLSIVYDGTVDHKASGVWAVRSDGTLLYFSVTDGHVAERKISYGNGPGPVIAGNRLLSFSVGREKYELKIRSFTEARVDFDDSVGPITTVSISGEPLAAMIIPDTNLIFIAVRWREGLAFELVDVDQRRSLSQPVVLSASDEWGPSTRQVGLLNQPSPALAKGRLSYDEKTRTVLLITPLGHAFEVPMGHEEWHKALAEVIKWRPELGAAEALGFDATDYPVRPDRDVALIWTRKCGEADSVVSVQSFLARFLQRDPDAGRFSGTAAAHGATRFSELFPTGEPGCSSLE